MKDSILFVILLQIFLILLNAVFACAEVAIISMNDNKLASLVAKKDPRALKLDKLTKQPSRFLSTIQIAITLSGFLGSAFAAENFSGLIVSWLVSNGVTISVSILESLSVIVITLILSYFTLVFGELVPKQLGMRKAESLALNMSGFITFISTLFAPLVWLLMKSTNLVLKMLSINPDEEIQSDSEEEIKMMIDVGSEKGTIDIEEKNFIKNVFEFDDLQASEILTHRTDIVMLDINEDIDTWHHTIISNKYSYYPICDDKSDKIIGILNTKQYFRLENKDKEHVLNKAVDKPYFVYDTVKADVLFKNMKSNKSRLAIVLDEYGGVSGMITIHDLIEELVGDLEQEISKIQKVNENTYIVDGSILIEELEEILNLKLENEEYETLNGYIFHNLGHIPDDGSDLELDLQDMHITIYKIVNHQVETAMIKVKDKEL